VRTVHALPAAHGAHAEPPQSTSVSEPLRTPSLHELPESTSVPVSAPPPVSGFPASGTTRPSPPSDAEQPKIQAKVNNGRARQSSRDKERLFMA
jgi:hypothetical protein